MSATPFLTPTPSTKKKASGKGLNAPKSVGGTPRHKPAIASPRHSLLVDDDSFAYRSTLLVYDHAKSIDNVPNKIQGVWQSGYQATVSPTELWIFPKEYSPPHLEGSKHIHGVWGLAPDACEPGDPLPDDLSTIDPLNFWVFPPHAAPPKFFTVRGVWTYPLIKRDISQLSPEQAGFVHIGDSVKSHKLDVGGSWKMLYRRDGLPEAPLGPGLSSERKKAPKPMTVMIETPSGKRIPLEKVLPTETLDQLMDRIAAQHGMPKDQQRLINSSKNDTPLNGDPTQSLKKLGVQDQDVLKLQGITVHVQPFRGPPQTLTNLDPYDTTVDELQDQIKSVPKPLQRLFFQGQPLTKPMATLGDCGIVHDSTINLEPIEVTVQTPNGQSITLLVDPNDTIRDIKQQIEDDHDIPIQDQRLEFQGRPLQDPKTVAESGLGHGDSIQLAPMEILVQDDRGNEYPVTMNSPDDTIDDLKTRLEEQHDIPQSEQRLAYQGKPLDDDKKKTNKKSLRSCGIQHGSIVNLLPMEISVKDANGKEFPVKTWPDDTIDDLKTRIEQQTKIPKAEQKLAYQGKPLDDDDETLRDCGIDHGSKLDLLPMQITVTDDQGNEFPVQILPEDTVDDLKNRIQKQENIPKANQRLVFQGKPLDNDQKPLRSYGIQDGSTLDLLPMEVIVKDADGNQFPVVIQPNDTVHDLKARIEDQEGIPKEDQHLSFQGKPLDKDNKSLRSCGIQHGSILDLLPMTIKVEIPNGQKVSLVVFPTDTIADIKDKLEQSHGVPAKDFPLSFKDAVLPDNSTLRDNGIKYGDALKVISGMEINIKDWKNKVTTLKVKPSDTIGSIRAQLEPLKDLDADKQILTFKDTRLEDNSKSLSGYGIANGSTIQLDKFKIYVECPSHGKFVMEADPIWKIKRIQQSVEANFKIKLDRQEPSFRGKQLTKDDTIGGCGIQYKDTVIVKETQIPEFDVQMGDWQNPFHYSPKSYKKKVGVRRKSTRDGGSAPNSPTVAETN